MVFTALIGEYETLIDQPLSVSSGLEFICFTDNVNVTSSTWRIILISPKYPRDNVRSARYIKALGFAEFLSDYDESLWIDNRVQLTKLPELLFDEFLTTNDMALPLHSFRETVEAEFFGVLERGYDDPARVREQLSHYRLTNLGDLELRPYWTAILFRKHTPEVISAMRVWMDSILRYSRRDQLSIRHAIVESGLNVRSLSIDNRASDWHRWLPREAVGRNEVAGSWGRSGFSYSLRERLVDRFHSLQLVDRLKWTAKKLLARGAHLN